MKSRFSLLDTLTRVVSYLPLSVLYVKSWLLSILVGRIFSYRRNIVVENLSKSFPSASSTEITRWTNRFYRNLTDIMAEIIKARTISKAGMRKRMEVINSEMIDALFDEGKSALIVCGHRGNWEWAGLMLPLIFRHKVAAVYKPLSNKAFDRLMHNIRDRFGSELLPMKSAARHLASNKDPWLRLFVADQSPPKHESKHFISFLEQETPVILGPGKISIATGQEIFFMDILRSSRGRYILDFKKIRPENPKDELSITQAYSELLEQGIHQEPDNWLWSHRRWKNSPENQSRS